MNNEPISNNNTKDDQEIIKFKFQNGVKQGKPGLAEDLIKSCKSKIVVNIKPLKPKRTTIKKYPK
ncbi:hypothetical protein DRN73_09710 [Candidatus Pacearchaeota archaeon]|nr:MAG: hypothetical protein DRN73_09710 [Candidatus Pacearchaeota archaeon]